MNVNDNDSKYRWKQAKLMRNYAQILRRRPLSHARYPANSLFPGIKGIPQNVTMPWSDPYCDITTHSRSESCKWRWRMGVVFFVQRAAYSKQTAVLRVSPPPISVIPPSNSLWKLCQILLWKITTMSKILSSPRICQVMQHNQMIFFIFCYHKLANKDLYIKDFNAFPVFGSLILQWTASKCKLCSEKFSRVAGFYCCIITPTRKGAPSTCPLQSTCSTLDLSRSQTYF